MTEHTKKSYQNTKTPLPERTVRITLDTEEEFGLPERRWDPPVRPIYEVLQIEPNHIVVEYAAGDGHYTLPIAQEIEDHSGPGLVFALEHSGRLIETLDAKAVAAHLDSKIRPMPLDEIPADTIPLADEGVDRVFSVNGVHFLPDPLPVYKEMARVLKPGGVALIVDWQSDAVKTDGSPPTLDFERTAALLREAGFSDVQKIQPWTRYNAIRALKSPL